MAPLAEAPDAFDFPLTPGMGALLQLEDLMAALARTQAEPDPAWTHLLAFRLAAILPELEMTAVDGTFLPEAQRWIDFLDTLAGRPGADGGKVARMRQALDSLSQRLAAEWPDYLDRLHRDPWLAVYAEPASEGRPRPGPQAWMAMGAANRQARLEAWQGHLEPLATLAEAVLRLTRDSLQWRSLEVLPEGSPLDLPAEPGSGLVRVLPAEPGLVPTLATAGSDIALRLHSGADLGAEPRTGQATLGWFTL
jgi:cell division FtsZ-interacting protein ZapD